MKVALKTVVATILGWQVRRLYKKSNFKTIGVAGSVGKTSTKLAVSQILATKFKVRYQEGNYNDIVSVPLIFFGLKMPNLFNPLSWLMAFLKIEVALSRKYDAEVVVVELGIDGPGQMDKFAKYLRLDYALITAIGPEHLEFFDDVAQIAEEEFAIANFADEVIINANSCPEDVLSNLKFEAEMLEVDDLSVMPLEMWEVRLNKAPIVKIESRQVSPVKIYALSCGAVLARKLGMQQNEINAAIKKVKAVPGRMNIINGINGSIIIDDTYNASPDAMIVALKTLYDYPAKQKIAILGNMNELGKMSEELHKKVGKFCDPKKLNLVLTIGSDANKYLASEAIKKGCTVLTMNSPLEAGKYVKPKLNSKTVVLAKGSQNGVFAEEAVKLLLENPEDEKQLVRQEESWRKLKKKNLYAKN